MAGLSGNVNLVAGGVQYALFIIFSSIMFFFVDKIGRRTVLISGALGMAFCHFVVGGIMGVHGVNVPEGVNGDANILIRVTGPPAYTVIAFSYLLVIVYALTLAPICWIYAAEVWSLETRATGMGISAIGNWLVRRDCASLTSKNLLTGDSSTLPSAFSFLLRSATSSTAFSCFSEASASWPQFSSGLPTPKPAARLSRRSRCSSATTVLAHGRQRRVLSVSTRRSALSRMLKLRMMLVLVLMQSWPRRARNTTKRLAKFKRSRVILVTHRRRFPDCFQNLCT